MNLRYLAHFMFAAPPAPPKSSLLSWGKPSSMSGSSHRFLRAARRRFFVEAALGIIPALANRTVRFRVVGEHSADAAILAAGLDLPVFLVLFACGAEHPLLVMLVVGLGLFLFFQFGLVHVPDGASVRFYRRRAWTNFISRLQRHRRVGRWLLERHPSSPRIVEVTQFVLPPVNRAYSERYDEVPRSHGISLADDSWDSFDGREFERYVGSVLAELGYRIVRYTPTSGDYGVDLVVKHGDSFIAVQVKHTQKAVGVEAVQAVVAGAVMYGCTRLMVVSSGGFTSAAYRLAAAHECQLLTAAQLVNMLRARSSRGRG